MKLYTVEQVKQAFVNGWMTSMTRDGHMTDHASEFVDSISPVELPSDAEIEKASDNAWSDYEYEEGNLYSTTFKGGWNLANKWVIDQIKNQQH